MEWDPHGTILHRVSIRHTVTTHGTHTFMIPIIHPFTDIHRITDITRESVVILLLNSDHQGLQAEGHIVR